MSEIRVNKIINEQGTGSIELTQGASVPSGKTISGSGDINLTGIVTASSFYGDGSNLSGIATFSGDYNDLSNQPSIPSIVGLASEGYVDVAVANLVDSAPSTLDTLNELATALGDDANFSTTVTNSLANKANLSGANFTGVVTATSFSGDGSNLTGIDATALKDTGGTVIVQANSDGINVTGVVTATSFSGDGSNLTGVSGGSTVADDTSTDETFYPIFTQTTSGTVTATKVSTTNLTFNPSTGNLSAVDFNSTSDQNLKENIKPIDNPIEKVIQLSGVTFDWKSSQQSSAGVIAQEVEKVLPEIVRENDGHKSVSYNGLIGLLIEVVKDQQEQINTLSNRIDINNK